MPEKVAGIDARRMSDLFKDFLGQEVEIEWKSGQPVSTNRWMTADVIRDLLKISEVEAQTIQQGLIDEGYLEAGKNTPTRKGMALSHHRDRPKLSRADAEAILNQVLDWADRTNGVAGARVKVKAIHLYGSLERGKPMVGDIDLFVEFSTMDLGYDLLPEDTEREDDLCEELTKISEYLSPSGVIDREVMSDVPMRQVFPRNV